MKAKNILAIPYCFRAQHDDRAPTWVDTEQGQVLDKVEYHIQRLVEKGRPDILMDASLEMAVIADRLATYADQLHKPPVPEKATPSITEAPVINKAPIPESIVTKMERYVSTGDITHIAPRGRLGDKEKTEYSHFTMVDIKQVNGRTIHASKTSNGKPLSFFVLDRGVEAKVGKAVVLDDGEVITAVIQLGDDAELLSKTFNSLYR